MKQIIGVKRLFHDYSNDWRHPGARWWKFDFHVHTPASDDYGKGPDQPSLKRLTEKEWLLNFMRAEVDCVVVTDHNTGEWVDRLKSGLEKLEQEDHPDFRSLHIFPGVELSVNVGFHLLAILDTDKGTSDIDSLIGAVDYQGEKGDRDGVTRKSAVEVVEIVLERGGIPVLAHADDAKGLLRPKTSTSMKTALDPLTVGQVLDSPGMLAMEVTAAEFEKPQIYLQRGLSWAEILGSDSHHPVGDSGEKFPGSHYTWVKMAKPSLDGLRLALLDGRGFSIRRSDEASSFDPFALPKYYIESIEIVAARYMGRGARPARLDFNPWLNALVGGRGTGKSTVVHALRLAARREWDFRELPVRTGSGETFERFARVPSDQTGDGGLTDDTAIHWTLKRDGVRHRINWRRDGTGVTVEDENGDGDWEPSSAQTVTPDRFPLQLFSQGQIADLAGDDPTGLLREIDRAAGVGTLHQKLNEAVATYGASRARIRELDSKLHGLEDATVVELEDVERKLGRFEAAGHSAVLTAYRLRQRQRREVGRQFEGVEEAAKRIESAAHDLALEDLPDGLFDRATADDGQVIDLINSLRIAVDLAAREAKVIAGQLRGVADRQREVLGNSTWEASSEQAGKTYRILVRDLEKDGVDDPNEYGTLVQGRQRLESQLQVLQSEEEERNRLLIASQTRLQEVCNARSAVTDARRQFLSEALAQNNFVRLEIRPYGDDHRIIAGSLREVLGVLDNRFTDDILAASDNEKPKGAVADLIDDELPEEPDGRASEIENRLQTLKGLFQSACHGQGGFGGHFSNFLNREFNRAPEFLDNLLTWYPEDGLSVNYSRTGDGKDFRPISQASAGQRSAAMLAFLLAHGDEPLVLDQPEDDLDNHLIYDLVVRQIRENKFRRQIIVVTHNPNIVVNGDAEMLHALDFEGGQCVVKQSGSLQDEAMREEICRVMEGGREAFRRRYRRLGPGPVHV